MFKAGSTAIGLTVAMPLAYVSMAILVATVQARYSQYQQTYQSHQAIPSANTHVHLSPESMSYNRSGQYRQTSYTNQKTTNNIHSNQVTPWLMHISNPVRIAVSSEWVPANHGYETVNSQVASDPSYYGNQYSAGPEVNNQGYGMSTHSSSSGTINQGYHYKAAVNNQDYQSNAYHTNSPLNNQQYNRNTAMNNHGYYNSYSESLGMDMSYLPFLLDGEQPNAIEMSMLMDPGNSHNMLPYYLMENGPENMLPLLALSGGQGDQGIQQYMMMTIGQELF